MTEMTTLTMSDEEMEQGAWPWGDIIGLDLDEALYELKGQLRDRQEYDNAKKAVAIGAQMLMDEVNGELAKHGLEMVIVEPRPDDNLGWAIRSTQQPRPCPECAKPFAKYWKGWDPEMLRPDGQYGAHVFHLPTAHGRDAFLEVVGGACIAEAEEPGQPNICVLVA